MNYFPSWFYINLFNFNFFCGDKFVASKLGIASPPPYLSMSLNNDAILKGLNYASGGAGILNETGLYFVLLLLLLLILDSPSLFCHFYFFSRFLIEVYVLCAHWADSEIIFWWSNTEFQRNKTSYQAESRGWSFQKAVQWSHVFHWNWYDTPLDLKESIMKNNNNWLL